LELKSKLEGEGNNAVSGSKTQTSGGFNYTLTIIRQI